MELLRTFAHDYYCDFGVIFFNFYGSGYKLYNQNHVLLTHHATHHVYGLTEQNFEPITYLQIKNGYRKQPT